MAERRLANPSPLVDDTPHRSSCIASCPRRLGQRARVMIARRREQPKPGEERKSERESDCFHRFWSTYCGALGGTAVVAGTGAADALAGGAAAPGNPSSFH